jgi:hypothetical protein
MATIYQILLPTTELSEIAESYFGEESFNNILQCLRFTKKNYWNDNLRDNPRKNYNLCAKFYYESLKM